LGIVTGMLLIGLSGILPLMLTLVQKSFYLAAALPFVALGLGAASAPALASLLERGGAMAERIARWTGMALCGGALLAATWWYGRPSRDADMLADVEAIARTVPSRTTIGVDPDLRNEWNLQCYLMRQHFVSLDPDAHGPRWFLSARDAGGPGDGYVAVGAELKGYTLWERMPGPGGSRR
jgi:hypothetical protein